MSQGSRFIGEGQTERLLRINRHPRLNSVTGKVVRIPGSPLGLPFPTARGLAPRPAASPLSATNSIVGTKPAMADATRTIPGNEHDEPSSPRFARILSCNVGYRSVGSLWESRPGSASKSAEGPAEFPIIVMTRWHENSSCCFDSLSDALGAPIGLLQINGEQHTNIDVSL
jgi:hypothetical protein